MLHTWLHGTPTWDFFSLEGKTRAARHHIPAPPPHSQVVYRVHVKSRCAWLNHTSEPQVFMQLVRRFPNIKLWLSGHFHVSHNYPGAAEKGGVLQGVAGGAGAGVCMPSMAHAPRGSGMLCGAGEPRK